MLLKKVIPAILLLSVCGQALAAQIITVSRFEIGKEKWPFNREEVMLTCEKDGAMFAINPSTLMTYPLNDIADTLLQKQTGESAADQRDPGRRQSASGSDDESAADC